jgi:hypothetical protein
MSSSNTNSNAPAVEVPSYLEKGLGLIFADFARDCVSKLSAKYGISEASALNTLGINDLKIVKPKVSAKAKKEKAPKEKVPPVPFDPHCRNKTTCQYICYNNGLFTQCTRPIADDDMCCKKCAVSNCGSFAERASVGLYDFTDDKNRKPVAYSKVIAKLGFTEEQVKQYFSTNPSTNPSRITSVILKQHLEYIPPATSGRGRPKKTSEVQEERVPTPPPISPPPLTLGEKLKLKKEQAKQQAQATAQNSDEDDDEEEEEEEEEDLEEDSDEEDSDEEQPAQHLAPVVVQPPPQKTPAPQKTPVLQTKPKARKL